MKNLLITIIALFAFNASASSNINFFAQGKDLASPAQNTLFNENIGLRIGKVKSIPVIDWGGRATYQALKYEVTVLSVSLENRGNIRAKVKAVVSDISGAVPVEILSSPVQTTDITFGQVKTLSFEAMQNGVMFNHSIDFNAIRPPR